jgi:hypothetical protein
MEAPLSCNMSVTSNVIFIFDCLNLKMEFEQKLAKEDVFYAPSKTNINSPFSFVENTISAVVYVDMVEK